MANLKAAGDIYIPYEGQGKYNGVLKDHSKMTSSRHKEGRGQRKDDIGLCGGRGESCQRWWMMMRIGGMSISHYNGIKLP